MRKRRLRIPSQKLTILFLITAILIFITGASTVSAKAKTLKMACHYSRPHPYAVNAFYFADRVKELSGGKMEIRVFEGGVLAKLKEEYKIVTDGVVDMAWLWISAYEAGKMPVADVFNIPFFISNIKDWPEKSKEIKPLLQPDFAKYNTVAINLWLVAGYVVCGQKRFAAMDDLKNVLARASGGNFTRAVSLWGAKPVTIGVSDIYPGLQRGTVEATVITLPSYFGLKLYEVTTHVNLTPFPCLVGGTAIHKPVWNNLSAQERKFLHQASDDAGQNYLRLFHEDLASSAKRAKATGEIINYLTPAEIKRMKTAINPLYDKYIKKAGERGKKIVEILRR